MKTRIVLYNLRDKKLIDSGKSECDMLRDVINCIVSGAVNLPKVKPNIAPSNKVYTRVAPDVAEKLFNIAKAQGVTVQRLITHALTDLNLLK